MEKVFLTLTSRLDFLDADERSPTANQGRRLTIYGGVVDPAYSQMLMQKTDLPLADVLALDRVQKKLSIPDDAARHLRQSKLIEGRKPPDPDTRRTAENGWRGNDGSFAKI